MDKNKTLEVLENDFWGEPDFHSYLVLNCHKLRKVPLNELTTEDLRLLIGQNIGLVYLLPIAFDKLEMNLLDSGDFYAGDLLIALSKINEVFWQTNQELKWRASELIHSLESVVETLQDAKSNFAKVGVQ